MVAWRTWIQDPWRDWNAEFVREVAAHANAVVIRVPGLLRRCRVEVDFTSRDTESILWWESVAGRTVRSVVGRADCVATVILPFEHYNFSTYPLDRGRPISPSQRAIFNRSWRRTQFLSERCRYMLHSLRSCVRQPLWIWAEDFAARWTLDSGIRPEYWVLDQPFIGLDDALGRYSSQLSVPGFVRNSMVPQMRNLHIWKVDMPGGRFAAELPQEGITGVWRPSEKLKPRGVITVLADRLRIRVSERRRMAGHPV